MLPQPCFSHVVFVLHRQTDPYLNTCKSLKLEHFWLKSEKKKGIERSYHLLVQYSSRLRLTKQLVWLFFSFFLLFPPEGTKGCLKRAETLNFFFLSSHRTPLWGRLGSTCVWGYKPVILPQQILLINVHSTRVLPRWHVKDHGHSAKSAGGKLHINTHTFLTHWRQSGLTMPLSGHSVGTCPEMSSHATCQGTFSHSHLSSLSHCGLIPA